MPAKKKSKKKSVRPARRAAPRARARKPSVRRQPTLASVAIGDAVRISASNLIGRYDPSVALERGGEVIEGLVSSIRQISTGKLVPKTTADLSGYVLEVVHTQTFRPHLASDANTGGARASDDARESPAWHRLQTALRAMAGSKRLVSISTGGISDGSIRPLLDGWRVVKVKAQHAEAMT
ncbi:MAG: hypothetical protein ACE149_04070 [Armatimonadota bacterium]